MTREEVLAVFTEKDRKALNKAKQVMDSIYFKLAGTSFENKLVGYFEHCLYDGMDAIEAIEAKITEIEEINRGWKIPFFIWHYFEYMIIYNHQER